MTLDDNTILEDLLNDEEVNNILSRFVYDLSSIYEYSEFLKNNRLTEGYKIYLEGEYLFELPEMSISKDYLEEIKKLENQFDFSKTTYFDYDNPAVIYNLNQTEADFIYLKDNIFDFDPRIGLKNYLGFSYITNPTIQILDSKPKLISVSSVRFSKNDKLIPTNQLYKK